MTGDTGVESDTSGIERVLADGRGRDQSILVVGDGLVAGATAAFLEQAGLHPVVAPSFERPQTGIRILWEPGLALLERIGLRRPIERVGTPIERLRCQTVDRSWTAVDGQRSSLIAVECDRLHTVLMQQRRDRITETERSVIGVEPADAGIRVTFDGTTTELFDTVVTTTRALLPMQTHLLSGQRVHTWNFECPSNAAAPNIPTEAWDTDVAAFSVPVSGDTWIRLVSMAEMPPASALALEALAQRFGHLFEGEPFAELDRQQLQYRRRARAVPRSLARDGLVLAGAGARIDILGDCLSTTLGIEDAWVLADALAYGPADTGSAIATYEQRRRKREREINAAIHDRVRATHSLALSPSLERLYTRRRLAFQQVTGQSLPEFAKRVPHDI